MTQFVVGALEAYDLAAQEYEDSIWDLIGSEEDPATLAHYHSLIDGGVDDPYSHREEFAVDAAEAAAKAEDPSYAAGWAWGDQHAPDPSCAEDT